jgi:formate--tetrahydrofolate ligase
MGAERFFNIRCRASGLTPDTAVVVATVRALKSHSGKYRVVADRPLPEEMLKENPDDVIAGAANLRKQLENVRAHGVEPVVAINSMLSDFLSEHAAIRAVAAAMGIRTAVCTNFTEGGRGAAELAEAVAEVSSIPNGYSPLYPLQASLKEKIETLATRVYGAEGVDYTPLADRQLAGYEKNGFGNLPVCIAKTQYSLSHDGTLKGAPTGFRLPVREVRASVGAGFVYPICGNMRTMPGLSSHPAAESIDLDEKGNVVGCTELARGDDPPEPPGARPIASDRIGRANR